MGDPIRTREAIDLQTKLAARQGLGRIGLSPEERRYLEHRGFGPGAVIGREMLTPEMLRPYGFGYPGGFLARETPRERAMREWQYTGPTRGDILVEMRRKMAEAGAFEEYQYRGPRWPEEFPGWEELGGPWYQEMQERPTQYGGGGYSPRYTYGGGGDGLAFPQQRGPGPGVGRIYAPRQTRGQINAQGLVTWRI